MDQTKKKTLVLGASANPERYSFLAVNSLRKHGHPVTAIGNKPAAIADVEVGTEKKAFTDINTVTLYLNPKNQLPYYDYILALNPQRIIFNPGTENDELAALAHSKGIQTQEACTLVLLSTGQF
jgi:hypothetical protein